jgi:hypothetical protein
MTPARSATIALGWLAVVTPGLRAAAVLDADGRVVAGDAALGREVAGAAGAAAGAGPHVVRGERLTLAARVDGPVLGGLLAADLGAAVALAEHDRAA